MANHVWGESETQFFFQLDPNVILNSVDSLGLSSTGRVLTLNSMENRVYEIEIDSDSDNLSDHFVIAKFYRPGRWSREQILAEHKFLLELQEEDIPVIAPKVIHGETLFQVADHQLFYTVFPKKGGRIPEEMNKEQLEIVGRLLARIHNVGARSIASSRIEINPVTFGINNLEYLLQNNTVPAHLHDGFNNVVKQICELITPMFKGIPIHRIHGDCHTRNIIYRELEGPFFIDFDDMLMGPAIQDIWLVVPGEDQQAIEDRNILIDSYEIMRSFDFQTLKLIEPLRSLRYIHFAAWMARRWDDPAFKKAFPYFGTDQYWSTLTTDLHQQLHKIQGNYQNL